MQTMEEITRSRVTYQSTRNRPRLELPNGAKLAVWTIVNVEHWLSHSAMPRTVLPPPMGQTLLPDIPNWAWHEYGMRVGFWRMFDALGSRGIKATLAVNANACSVYREACGEARGALWEFIGHGFVQGPMHLLKDQQGSIRDAVDLISNFTGQPVRGWESPGLTETDDTVDYLAAAGVEYVADWVLDDQPTIIKGNGRELVSVPYTVELNDVVLSAVQQQPSDEILRRGRDQFDRLFAEGADNAKIMAISVHPYLTGAPHRIKYLEALYDYILGHDGVVMWTGEQILDWYNSERVRLQL